MGVTLVAAGLAASDLIVSASAAGVLKVEGETKRTGSKIARSFKLPRDADASLATACHVDGILTLKVPKKAEAAKQIAFSSLVEKKVASSATTNDGADDDMDAEPTKNAAKVSDAEE